MSSSSTPTAQNEWSYKQAYASILPWVTPPVAAGVAIVPVFYGFMAKSALQTSTSPVVAPALEAFKRATQKMSQCGVKPVKRLLSRRLSMIATAAGIPVMSFSQALKTGLQAAPTVSLLIGTQMIAQKKIEKGLEHYFPDSFSGQSWEKMLLSSALVGTVSILPLAIFNGKTMKKTAMESIKGLSLIQGIAIVSRETTFIVSQNAGDLVSEKLKRYLGENQCVDYFSAAASGAIGSVIGHPFDTLFTLDQKGLRPTRLSQLMRGVSTKAVTLAGFSVCYKAAGDLMKATLE